MMYCSDRAHRAQKKIRRVLFFDTPPLQIYILKKSQKKKFNMVRAAFKIGANLPERWLGPSPRCRGSDQGTKLYGEK